jgi:hypothetical protein
LNIWTDGLITTVTQWTARGPKIIKQLVKQCQVQYELTLYQKFCHTFWSAYWNQMLQSPSITILHFNQLAVVFGWELWGKRIELCAVVMHYIWYYLMGLREFNKNHRYFQISTLRHSQTEVVPSSHSQLIAVYSR